MQGVVLRLHRVEERTQLRTAGPKAARVLQRAEAIVVRVWEHVAPLDTKPRCFVYANRAMRLDGVGGGWGCGGIPARLGVIQDQCIG